MALNFPNSPSDGQIYIDGSSGNRWVWDTANTCWKSTSTFTQTITVSTTSPGTPVVGQLWWNKDYGRLLVYYNDGDSNQWVEASPADGYGILAFGAANAAFNTANAAFASANNVAPQVTPSFNTANAAFDTANAAFASANNVAPQVTPAFLTANLAYSTANAAYGIANDGYAAANTKLANTDGVYTAGSLNISGNLTVNNFVEFSQNITYNYTITVGRNALSAGPVSIANGNVVTIPSGSVWTVT
jgi:hypothetical protein